MRSTLCPQLMVGFYLNDKKVQYVLKRKNLNFGRISFYFGFFSSKSYAVDHSESVVMRIFVSAKTRFLLCGCWGQNFSDNFFTPSLHLGQNEHPGPEPANTIPLNKTKGKKQIVYKTTICI